MLFTLKFHKFFLIRIIVNANLSGTIKPIVTINNTSVNIAEVSFLLQFSAKTPFF
jgi:hypothetical protein